MPPAYIVGWIVDKCGTRQWYNGAKDDRFDMCQDIEKAKLFTTMRKAMIVGQQIASRNGFVIDSLTLLQPEVWMLKDGNMLWMRVFRPCGFWIY
jgi:hypothetical protein